MKITYFKISLFCFVFAYAIGHAANTLAQSARPSIYAVEGDKAAIQQKIKTEAWAAGSWKKILDGIDKYVNRHQQDPKWITSRLAMYWKKGEHYTQCYLREQNWDYGTGNAPVPTVRMPGMRVWNEYLNVPLEDRKPYNETGDMKGISRANPEKGVVLVPYKKSGHMIRGNNNEILTLAEKAAFVYWITAEEKYAKFAADIFNTWLIGTYYMNPILDPGKSSGGPGGYEPGGILGYYDYEQIHDDLSTHTAVVYDFMADYLKKHNAPAVAATGKSYDEVAAAVFKRFIEIGMVRGGKKGNWNVNGWEMIMPAILTLDANSSYADGKGKAYYLKYYTTESTPYHDALPDILAAYDPVTGLWPESPGYASGTISSLLKMALPLYKSGLNTISGNPMMQKAALSIFPWLDARGNLVNFGDGRGGPGDYGRFENLLTYYQWTNDQQNVNLAAAALQQGIVAGQYNRADGDWKNLCFNVARIPVSGKALSYARTAYSPVHRHLIQKNGNDSTNALMFTLYGGYAKQKHMSPNGLALQLYGKGWALAPDASGYTSYWTPDYNYHQSATGSNTILPGYTAGPITVNAVEPFIDSTAFTNSTALSSFCSFADVSAAEKRRTVAMIRTGTNTGYYVDIFRSGQQNNDYLYHNLGKVLKLYGNDNKPLILKKIPDLDTVYNAAYSYFKKPEATMISEDINASWIISSVKPALVMDMWMKGAQQRELIRVQAPYTNLNAAVSPNKVNIAPDPTHAIIVRQNNVKGWEQPFVGVFEPHDDGAKSITGIQSLSDQKDLTALQVNHKAAGIGSQIILHSVSPKKYNLPGQVSFMGTLGVISENNNGLQYLYLGKGNLLKSGKYGLEVEGKNGGACLMMSNGVMHYSATSSVKITVPVKQGKEFYITGSAGTSKLITTVDKQAGVMSAVFPAGYEIEIKLK
ncbi:hypothetical protein [Pedobacter heparinus]|uniref:hypothetical protein n=1 Tax=Pedobacter heparinus TaxID=984 RepID=UPI002930B881|nr:hypothetical protein [Pedobacter heparinus]